MRVTVRHKAPPGFAWAPAGFAPHIGHRVKDEHGIAVLVAAKVVEGGAAAELTFDMSDPKATAPAAARTAARR